MSSNTLATELMPRIIGNSREYLRRKTSWLPILNHDFSDAAGKIGQKVQVPIPVDLSIGDLSAGQLPPVANGKSFSVVELTLDSAKVSESFTIEQLHLQNYQISGPNSVLQQQINAAIDTVIGALSDNLFSKYIQIPTFVGTGGTEFFTDANAASINGLADVHYALNQQKLPDSRPRHGILSFKDWQKLQKVTEVRQAYSIGTAEVIQNNNWPSILGFGLKNDYFVPTHTVGTIGAGGLKVTANTVAGTSSVGVTNGANATALVAGDIVTINSVNYSLASNTTAIANATDTLVLDRGLDSNITANAAVTLATNFGSGRVNIFGDFLGVGVVTRIPENPVNVAEFPVKLLGEHFPITDPMSGVTVLLSFYGQYFQRTMQVSLVYGTRITHAARLVRAISAV